MIKANSEESKEMVNFAILGKAQGTDVTSPYYRALISTIKPLYKMMTEDNVLVAIAKRCVESGEFKPLTEYIYKLYKTLNNDNGDNFEVLSTNSTTIEKIHYSFIKNEYTFIQEPNSIMITDVVFLTPQMEIRSYRTPAENDKLNEVSNLWVKYLSEQNLDSMLEVFIDRVDFSIKNRLEYLSKLFLNSDYHFRNLKPLFLSESDVIFDKLENFSDFTIRSVSKSLLDTETLIILSMLHENCSIDSLNTLYRKFGYDFSSYPGEITPYKIAEYCKDYISKDISVPVMEIVLRTLCVNLKKLTNAEIKELFSDIIGVPDENLAIGDFFVLLKEKLYNGKFDIYNEGRPSSKPLLMFNEIAFLLYSAFY